MGGKLLREEFGGSLEVSDFDQLKGGTSMPIGRILALLCKTLPARALFEGKFRSQIVQIQMLPEILRIEIFGARCPACRLPQPGAAWSRTKTDATSGSGSSLPPSVFYPGKSVAPNSARKFPRPRCRLFPQRRARSRCRLHRPPGALRQGPTPNRSSAVSS